MKLPLLWTKEAQREFHDAIDWYDEQQAGFGLVFQTRVTKAINKIQNHPQLYGFVFENARCLRVHRHPHEIIYSIETNGIVVWAVFHAKRNPEIWKRRIRGR